MLKKLSEISAALLCWAVTALACANELTLPQATAELIKHNPQLGLYQARFKWHQAEQEQAQQRPEWNVELELSEFAGTGEYQGTQKLESTLAISSVFELGNQRQARVELAQSSYQLTAAERELEAVSLIAQLTRNFIIGLALQERCDLASQHVQLTRTAHQQTQAFRTQGKSAEVEQMRAQVAIAQAELLQEQCQLEQQQSLWELAALLGQNSLSFSRLAGNLYQLAEVASPASLASLQQRLENSATVRLFSQQNQLKTAELALAQSQNSLDLNWRLGVSHYQESNDLALNLALSVPLRSAKRNLSHIQSLQAEQALQAGEQQLVHLNLMSQLQAAYQQQQHSQRAVQRLRQHIIPLLEKAQKSTAEGYQMGRYSYNEWQIARNELLNAKAELINNAERALLNQALIEQLTGEKYY